MKADLTRSTFDAAKHRASVRMQQGRVQMDADWNEQQDIVAHRIETETTDVLGPSATPADGNGFQLSVKNGVVTIGAGHYYAGGVLCENEAEVALDKQPDLPADKCIIADGVVRGLPAPVGTYLGVLHVFPRHLTALEDPSIRDVALDGPDTATRLKTVWQVQLLRLGGTGLDLSGGCGSPFPVWDELTAAPTGMLSARAEPAPPSANPCQLAPNAGYRRLDNLLYRVEIHAVPGEDPAFKWSHDNGSIAARCSASSPGSQAQQRDLTVSSLGRDTTLGIGAGQWLELFDDTTELLGLPGTLVQVLKAEGNTVTVDTTTAKGSLVLADFPLNPRVRRWDGWQTIKAATAAANAGGWIDLEDGVQILFSSINDSFRNGDYWMFAARTATSLFPPGVDWPVDAGHTPIPRLADGVRHLYARLGLLRFSAAAWTVVSDCRPRFPALTELTNLFYVGGDAQVVLLDEGVGFALPKPLVVGVANGSLPVENATIRFTATSGDLGNGPQIHRDVITGPDGLASCPWTLAGAPSPAHQYAEAVLLDGGATVPGKYLPVRFSACIVDEGADCACTICVTPAAHKNGAPSLQDAINKVLKAGGGTVCLEIGDYPLEEPLRIQRGAGIVIRGKGPRTRVHAPHEVIIVEGAEDIRLEEFEAEARALSDDVFAVVTLTDSTSVRLRGLDILVEDKVHGSGVLLTGGLDEIQVRDCEFRCRFGLTSLSEDPKVMPAVKSLVFQDNRGECRDAAVAIMLLEPAETLQLRGNRFTGCNLVGFEVMTAPDAEPTPVVIRGNQLEIARHGIATANANADIADNEIVCALDAARSARESRAGILCDPAESKGQLRAVGNRISGFSLAGIFARSSGTGTITGNRISACGNGIVVAGEGADDGFLIAHNQISDIDVPRADTGLAVGVYVAGARSVQVTDNRIANVGRDRAGQTARGLVAGVYVSASDRIQIANNEIFEVGSAKPFAGRVAGILVSQPAGEIDISGNRIRREANQLDPDESRWAAIDINPALRILTQNVTGAGFVLGHVVKTAKVAKTARARRAARVAAEKSAILMPGFADNIKAVHVAGFSLSRATVRGNQMAARGAAPCVQVDGLDACDFSNNQCVRLYAEADATGPAPVVVIASTAIVAGGNRVVDTGRGKAASLALTPVKGAFSVLGNVCNRPIMVLGAALMAPWDALNIIA